MTNKADTEQRTINVESGTARETYGGGHSPLGRLPQSVLDQIDDYRRSRELHRRELIRQLEDYDAATRHEEATILQIYEMSLQTRSRPWSLRDRGRDRKRDRDFGPER